MTRNPVRSLADTLFDIRTAVIAAGAFTLSAKRRKMLAPHVPKDPFLL